jgi:hypothetical protein
MRGAVPLNASVLDEFRRAAIRLRSVAGVERVVPLFGRSPACAPLMFPANELRDANAYVGFPPRKRGTNVGPKTATGPLFVMKRGALFGTTTGYALRSCFLRDGR